MAGADPLSGLVCRTADDIRDPEGVAGGRAEAGRDFHQTVLSHQRHDSQVSALPLFAPDWDGRTPHASAYNRSTSPLVLTHRFYRSPQVWRSVAIPRAVDNGAHNSTPTHLPAANFAFEPVHLTCPMPADTCTLAPRGTSVEVMLSLAASYRHVVEKVRVD